MLKKAALAAALALAKPFLKVWVKERGLKIPEAARPTWCKRLGLSSDKLDLAEALFQELVLGELDKVKI